MLNLEFVTKAVTNMGAEVVAYIDNDNISFYSVYEDGELSEEPVLQLHPSEYIEQSMQLLNIRPESV